MLYFHETLSAYPSVFYHYSCFNTSTSIIVYFSLRFFFVGNKYSCGIQLWWCPIISSIIRRTIDSKRRRVYRIFFKCSSNAWVWQFVCDMLLRNIWQQRTKSHRQPLLDSLKIHLNQDTPWCGFLLCLYPHQTLTSHQHNSKSIPSTKAYILVYAYLSCLLRPRNNKQIRLGCLFVLCQNSHAPQSTLCYI